MDSYNSFKEKIKGIIEKHNIAYKDYSFFMLTRLPGIAEKLEHYSSSCEECKKFMYNLEEQVNILPKIVSDDVSFRKKFEKTIDEISKHLRKTHKLVPARFFVAVFSTFGLFVGLLIGLLLSYLLYNSYNQPTVFASLGIAVFIGYFLVQ
jgi:tetrahydromethanopterin S-methyltransferase subunit G